MLLYTLKPQCYCGVGSVRAFICFSPGGKFNILLFVGQSGHLPGVYLCFYGSDTDVLHLHATPMGKGGKEDRTPFLGPSWGSSFFHCSYMDCFLNVFPIWRAVTRKQCPGVLPRRPHCVLTRRSSGDDFESPPLPCLRETQRHTDNNPTNHCPCLVSLELD